MDRVKKRSLYRLFLRFGSGAVIIAAVIIYMWFLNKKIPEHIYINENQQTVLCMDIPASGSITAENGVYNADLSKPVTFVAGETGHYTLKVNLFGIITYRNIDVDVVDEKYVYPGGFQIGMYLKTEGILVVNTEMIQTDNGENIYPCDTNISKGDYIIAINGEEISDKEQLSDAVGNCNGESILLKVRRDGKEIETTVTPVKASDETYKLGLWIKDDAQGIGTLTYVDENNNFSALGHGISDDNTGKVMEISGGRIYTTYVMSIIKGENGKPGELLGAIEYKDYNQIGSLDSNSLNGIKGHLTQNVIMNYGLSPLKIGYSYSVHEGQAYVRFYHKGQFKDYEINIESITNGAEKNITFQVKSDELISLTNGIVQGMSGCPIIQDGNIIGAVTHVFIDDSTKGYGVFIEKML